MSKTLRGVQIGVGGFGQHWCTGVWPRVRGLGLAEIVAVTRSEKGSVVVSGDQTDVIPGQKVDVVDTTGAGDAYAAGFLYAYTQGKPLDVCGKLGGLVASEAISHYGARAEADLKALAAGL